MPVSGAGSSPIASTPAAGSRGFLPGSAPRSREPGATRPSEIRQRILRAFSERARRSGLRGVVMIELARDLGMSSRTLYKHYPSKAALAQAMVEEWIRQFSAGRDRREAKGLRPVERLLEVVGLWADFTELFHPTFWTDLARDYPDAHATFEREVDRILEGGRRALGPVLQPGIHPDLAFGQLLASLVHAADADRCRRHGVTRRQAVRQAVEVWAGGAVEPSAAAARARDEA